MLSLLKCIFRYILTICLIAAIAFMVACTALVVVCFIRGDIKINIVRSKTEEDEKEVVEK